MNSSLVLWFVAFDWILHISLLLIISKSCQCNSNLKSHVLISVQAPRIWIFWISAEDYLETERWGSGLNEEDERNWTKKVVCNWPKWVLILHVCTHSFRVQECCNVWISNLFDPMYVQSSQNYSTTSSSIEVESVLTLLPKPSPWVILCQSWSFGSASFQQARSNRAPCNGVWFVLDWVWVCTPHMCCAVVLIISLQSFLSSELHFEVKDAIHVSIMRKQNIVQEPNGFRLHTSLLCILHMYNTRLWEHRLQRLMYTSKCMK